MKAPLEAEQTIGTLSDTRRQTYGARQLGWSARRLAWQDEERLCVEQVNNTDSHHWVTRECSILALHATFHRLLVPVDATVLSFHSVSITLVKKKNNI